VLRKHKIPCYYLYPNIGILLIIIFLLTVSGCTPKNSPADILEDINYHPTQIALLLPLESQNKNTNVLANNLKNAARLAAHDLKHLNLILTIYPTSGEPARAAYAAKAAVENGSQIIVGPLLSEETLAVKIALKKDLIKIISLSNDPSLAGNGVFIMGTSFQSVAKRLVTFSQSKGLKRIAIVSPKGPIGINGIEAAKDAIISNGSILSMIATYPLNVSGISELSPTIYENLINSNTDAIIFTDSPTRGLGFITEQISTLFKRNSKNMPQFMGLTRWDSAPSILDEPSLKRGWFVVPDQRFKKRYAARYFKTFGTNTIEISSLAYDAIALIGGVRKLLDPKTETKAFKQEHFTDKNGFIGVNGIFRFNQTGESDRSLSVAEVIPGHFKIIDDAKKQFMKNYSSQ
jgi:hypothetical protein